MTQHDDSEQLAWDFDVSVDGIAEPEITVDPDWSPVPNGGLRHCSPLTPMPCDSTGLTSLR